MILSTFLNCSKDNDLSNSTDHNFAIYLLKNPDLKIGDILTKNLVEQESQVLEAIEIQKEPWLKDDDIQFYDFSSHLLYLKRDKYNYLPLPVELQIPSSWVDKPFMIVLDGQKRYMGVFKGFYDIDQWPLPYIDISYNYLYPQDLLIISWEWFDNASEDNRNDPYVMEALKRANIFHKGLNLKLKDIKFLENSDTATVEYTFTIINNDVDILYILDPDKMGSGLFHFFNIGPQFLKSDEINVRSASFNKPVIPVPRDTWDPNWFIKLNSGDSITRTVSLRGYAFFPSGTYYCETTYQCIKKIPKEQRNLSDGRYWIGPTKSNLIAIQF